MPSPEQYSVFVDLSAKIEAWDSLSVVVVANGHAYALCLPAHVKTAIRNALPAGQEPPQFAIFAAAIYLTMRPHLAQIKRVRVDMDYSGIVAERAIRRRLLELVRRDMPQFKGSNIRIETVAGTRADTMARKCYRGKQATDGEITLAQLEDVLGVKG